MSPNLHHPRAALLAALALLGCRPAPAPQPPLAHQAYVWQRRWEPSLAEAVATAPRALDALRVLAVERGGPNRVLARPAVDVAALIRAGRPVVAVARIDGTAPLEGLGLGELAEVARAWQAAGLDVRAVEVDHDCPTAQLPAYAAWLRAERLRLDGRALTITALPDWAGGALAPLLDAVDGVTVQLHAVRAPALFDAAAARRWAERWAAASRRPFWVALPTYRARLAEGSELCAEPAEVAAFLRELERRPVAGLRGVAWFRLGHALDPDAWSAATLAAVISGAPLESRLAATLVPGPSGVLDAVVENRGAVDALAPARLSLRGELDALEGVNGYAPDGASLFSRAPPRLRAGARLTIGWVRGREVLLEAD